MGTPRLQVKNLHAGYGKAEILRGIALQAEAGSIITVIDPNGAGKSILLNALMGVLPATGSIEYAGRSIIGLPLEMGEIGLSGLAVDLAKDPRLVDTYRGCVAQTCGGGLNA